MAHAHATHTEAVKGQHMDELRRFKDGKNNGDCDFVVDLGKKIVKRK